MDAFITLISFPVLFQSSATGARQRVDNKLETCMHSTTSQMSTRDRIGAILRVTS
ncbi:citrate-proton symporter, partial [Klebsiella pneumoniae]